MDQLISKADYSSMIGNLAGKFLLDLREPGNGLAQDFKLALYRGTQQRITAVML